MIIKNFGMHREVRPRPDDIVVEVEETNLSVGNIKIKKAGQE